MVSPAATRPSARPACALKFLHDHNISHLDLKPRNILLSAPENPQLKLAGQGGPQGGAGVAVPCPPTPRAVPPPLPRRFWVCAVHVAVGREARPAGLPALHGPRDGVPPAVRRPGGPLVGGRHPLRWAFAFIPHPGAWLGAGFPLPISPCRSLCPPQRPFSGSPPLPPAPSPSWRRRSAATGLWR